MYRYAEPHPSVRYRHLHRARDIIALFIALVLVVIVPYVLDLLGIY
jgi:hypothetical protein